MNRHPAVAIDRRTFLSGVVAVPLAGSFLLGRGLAQTKPSGLIVREREPENLEFPFGTLDSFLTPNDAFYIRNHFPAPEIDIKSWKLKIEGVVEKPLQFSLEELQRLPKSTVTATLECAGNSRVFLSPREAGVQWELGAVGNAEWTGVPLSQVLEKAGVKKDAVEVILEGADEGELKVDPKSPGKIPFARSLPLKEAKRPEVLLAYQMNGKPLPAAHGFPLRAVVAGWYGMASVKWLKRLIVTDRPFQGHYQTFDYATWERRDGIPSLVPITAMQVKAAIARPAMREAIPAGAKYRVHGAAWAGLSAIARVDVSLNGGKTWAEAKLLDKPASLVWTRWEFEWKTPEQPGMHVVMARATDAGQRVQPMERDKHLRNYLIHHVLPIAVQVG